MMTQGCDVGLVCGFELVFSCEAIGVDSMLLIRLLPTDCNAVLDCFTLICSVSYIR